MVRNVHRISWSIPDVCCSRPVIAKRRRVAPAGQRNRFCLCQQQHRSGVGIARHDQERSCHLGQLGSAPAIEASAAQKPAIAVKRSVTPEYIVCLEDGKKLKMLKRYLRSNYNMTPEDYRAKWNLPADYPMVAPNYAAQRSEFAKKIGLGRNAPPAKSRRRG
jgi:predicted transcriptional regulator